VHCQNPQMEFVCIALSISCCGYELAAGVMHKL
jgi:hypothetical protein